MKVNHHSSSSINNTLQAKLAIKKHISFSTKNLFIESNNQIIEKNIMPISDRQSAGRSMSQLK